MPSQTNYQITINFAPVPGNITVTPLAGIALQTSFTIQLAGFYDENPPLTYSYIYYV
jgi:polycystin 1L2